MNQSEDPTKDPKVASQSEALKVGYFDKRKMTMQLATRILVCVLFLTVWADAYGLEAPLEGPSDPVISLGIVNPLDGAVETCPVIFMSQIVVYPGSEKRFTALYADKKLCLDSNGVISCCAVSSSGLVFEDWEPGNYTLRLFITDDECSENTTCTRYWQSNDTNFQVVARDHFNSYVDKLILAERLKYRHGFDQNLTDWAQQQQSVQPKASLVQPRMAVNDIGEKLFLLIGVKTAVVTNFPLRQAIRETWAREKNLPKGVGVLFLGCRPFTSIEPGEEGAAERQRQWEAIELEKSIYGDLLTGELNCDDNYLELAGKASEFLHLAATNFTDTSYVMIADDDVYIRLEEVLTQLHRSPRKRYVSGRVLSEEPIRNPVKADYLSERQYQLSKLPPSPLGAFLFLSMDCAKFISKNRFRLRDLGGMDDISISLWLLTAQIHPQVFHGLKYLRGEPCSDQSRVLGDLSPIAIRAIHANIAAKREFCHGFRRYVWMKSKDLGPPPSTLPRTSTKKSGKLPILLNDAVASVDIVSPLDGAIERPPVTFQIQINIRPGGLKRFKAESGTMHLCIETKDQAAEIIARSCSPITDPDTVIHLNQLGNFTAIAYLSPLTDNSSSTGDVYWRSKDISFSVVPEEEFNSYVADRIQNESWKYPGLDLGIISWAKELQQRQDAKLLRHLERDVNVFGTNAAEQLSLVIGIKTAVASNFAIRQAIRETWASKEELPSGVKVFFLGCRPFTGNTSADDERDLWAAIQLEKLVYNDLLTDELDCSDSYSDLASKVKRFFHFVATHCNHTQYVMVADDDLYVRVDQVLEFLLNKAPRSGFYSGQVRSIQNDQSAAPIRHNSSSARYVLTHEEYPMKELPPFAIGAYTFLSVDCVRFVSKNRQRLQDLDGMDDMSLALWMLAMQVHAQPFSGLEHIRGGPCRADLLALGDLSPLSIRVVHDSIRAERSLCHGFNRHVWFKSPSLAPPAGFGHKLPDFSEILEFDFSLSDPKFGDTLGIIAIIYTQSRAGVKLSILPALETPDTSSRRICAQVRLHLAGAVGRTSCDETSRLLKSKWQEFYPQVKAAHTVDSSRTEA